MFIRFVIMRSDFFKLLIAADRFNLRLKYVKVQAAFLMDVPKKKKKRNGYNNIGRLN